MAARIEYKASVERDLKALDKQAVARVLGEIEKKLAHRPDSGAPLTGEFKGLFRFRIGAWRVIYSKSRGSLLILRISHRKEAYR